MVKNPPANAGDIGDRGSILGSRYCHACRRAWRPTPVFLPEESHAEEPGGLYFMDHKELDTTDVT